jgi:hypothetical protein
MFKAWFFPHRKLARRIFLEDECVAQTQDILTRQTLVPDCGLGHLSHEAFAVPISRKQEITSWPGGTKHEGYFSSYGMFAGGLRVWSITGAT